MTDPVVGVCCCTLLRAEVRRALEAIGEADAPVRSLPSACHVPVGARAPAADAVEALTAHADHVVALCMNCVRPPFVPPGDGGRVGGVSHRRVTVVAVQAQGELFLRPEETTASLRAGAFLVLPGWLERWREIVCDLWGFDEETAPLFFGDSASHLLFLDTGVGGGWRRRLGEMAAFVGLGSRVRRVGTGRLQVTLTRAFERARERVRSEEQRREVARLRAALADTSTVVDFVTHLGSLLAEDEVVEHLAHTARLLFAPEDVSYTPPDGPAEGAGSGEGAPQPPGAAGRPGSRADPDDDGLSFSVHLRHGLTPLGSLRVERIACPEHMARYLPAARITGDAAALALNAAGLHRRERELVERLRATVEELDSFVYSASHDLQEPLRTIRGFCELLRTDLGEIPEQAEESLGFIVDAAKRLQMLIGSLLALSHASRQPLDMREVAAAECAGHALSALRAAIEEAGATISQDPLPSVTADPGLLTQVYQNLVGNALKFRGAAPPTIRFTAAEVDGETVLGVQDNGIGMRPEDAGRVFDPFLRLHGAAEYEGSGIGLSLCRRIVGRHGGRIWAVSAPGEGAHFLFTLAGGAAGTQELRHKTAGWLDRRSCWQGRCPGPCTAVCPV